MSGAADGWDSVRGAEIYDETVRAGRLYPALAERLAELLAPPLGAVLLDLACGTGVSSEPLLRRIGPEGRLVGIDRARAMLAVAARRNVGAPAAWLCADPAALPLRAAAFDAAAASAALWHFPAPDRVFEEVARVVRRGGRFVFNVPAAQLDDLDDWPPAPIQVALAREGERLLGESPAPAGPVRSRTALLTAAAAAGWAPLAERVDDLSIPQRELVELLAVPALGARLYPGVADAERRALFERAVRRVDPEEIVLVRWWDCLLERSGADRP